jgi:hypothetical protein
MPAPARIADVLTWARPNLAEFLPHMATSPLWKRKRRLEDREIRPNNFGAHATAEGHPNGLCQEVWNGGPVFLRSAQR